VIRIPIISLYIPDAIENKILEINQYYSHSTKSETFRFLLAEGIIAVKKRMIEGESFEKQR